MVTVTGVTVLEIASGVKESLLDEAINGWPVAVGIGGVEDGEEEGPVHKLEYAIITATAVLLPFRDRRLWDVGEFNGRGQEFTERLGLPLKLGNHGDQFLDVRWAAAVDVVANHLSHLVRDASEGHLGE